MSIPVNKTISVALRQFAANISKSKARSLTGIQRVDVPAVKQEIRDIADALDGRGKRKLKSMIPFSLDDSHDSGESIRGYAAWIGKFIDIYIEGYGKGKTPVCAVEFHEGRPRLIVWGDVNRDEPTHIINLDGAKADLEVEELEESDVREGGAIPA